VRTVTVAFDVDGTLRSRVTSREPVAREDVRSLMRVLSSFTNVKVVVWSGSGELYARQVARELHVSHWVHEYRTKGAGPAVDVAIDDEPGTDLAAVNLIVAAENLRDENGSS
jgi:hypothetical protein